MKVSQRWLQEFVDLDPAEWGPARVSDVLTGLGLEVEDVEDMSATLSGFVVGKVLTKEKHPKADKLSVCTVDVGDGTPRTIVCGASNVEAGQTVAVALVGAVVPTAQFTIVARPLRGVTSEGMICSKAELGLGEDHDGIWVLDVDAPVGTPLARALGIDDVVYDVAITPNRADCLSHVGIARDLAAYLSTKYEVPITKYQVPITKYQVPITKYQLAIRVEDADLCPHYIGHVVTGVKPIDSPQWLKDRLTSIGLRPRNIIVDVTNYVNMEMGQPLHAFDAAKLSGDTIVVRRATTQEKTFVTLDGKERTLTTDMLMICDAANPAAIAGVMGGHNSEVDDSTTTVVIESAYFDPSSIRRTAKVHGLSTDASYRFERGVNPAGVRSAADRAVQLLCDLAGGSAGQRIEVGTPPPVRNAIRAVYERICRLLGIAIDDHTITLMLESVGCDVTPVSNAPSTYNVVPPQWRADITIEADLAEEVMRLYGIDNIPSSTMANVSLDAARLPATLRAGGEHGTSLRNQLRTMLVARGYYDCVTNVLTSPERATVKLKNALGLDFSAMRLSIIPSLLKVASYNLRHGQQTVRLMEIGSQFNLDPSTELGVGQEEVLTLLVAGQTDPHWSNKPRALDLYDLVGELHILAPNIESVPIPNGPASFTNNVVELWLGGIKIGVAGEVQPKLAAQFDIERGVAAAVIHLRAVPLQKAAYRAVGQYPSVRRDLALIVDEGVTAGRIIDVARTASPLILKDVGVFDVYRDSSLGVGRKSIGIGLTFRSDERTLVEADVDSAVDSILKAATRDLGAHVRGTTMETT